jgi:succinyl-diaminopimelate desuccinylase
MDTSESKIVETLAARALELCRIPSPIGQERAIADHVEVWALRHYPREQVFRDSDSLVIGKVSDALPTVLLLGHLDTVPGHWVDREPRIESGRLFGLGSSDMKGGLAVMMQLAEAIPPRARAFNLVLVFYEREEGPYLESGLGRLLERMPGLTSAAFAIAMEPTDNVVQVGAMGSLHATLRFRGKAAHSARPWQGENAIHKAGPFLAELLELPRRQVSFDGHFFFEVFSVTRASAGRARNVVPDQLEMNLNYRFAPGKSIEQAMEDLRQKVAGRAEIEFTDAAPSGRVCTDNLHFKRLLALTGLPADAKQAWTDVARLTSMGIDAVNFGPGETAQAHQVNESAPIAALAHAYDKLLRFFSS